MSGVVWDIIDEATLKLYRQYYHKNDVIAFATYVFVMVLFAIAFSWHDWVRFGPSTGFYQVLILRSFMSVVLALLVWFFKNTPNFSIKLDQVIVAVFFLLVLNNYVIGMVRIGTYPQGAYGLFSLIYAVYILMYFLLVPIENHWLRGLPAIGFLVVTALHTTVSTGDKNINIILLSSSVMINLLGAYISFLLKEQRRQIFSLFIHEQETKAQLARSVELEKQLHETERVLVQFSAELKVLNAQIKPHFLSNVIVSANVLYRNKPETASALLENLSVYLKHAVNADLEMVKISEELEVVQAYLFIQQIRMEERLHFEFHCEYASEAEVPIYAVQTLVENAIIHGLQDCEEGGAVIVDIAEQNSILRVSVRDNCKGTDVDFLRNLVIIPPPVRSEERRSIGLWNVNRRLQLMGSRGLQFWSMPGEGTEVSFEIPLREDLA